MERALEPLPWLLSAASSCAQLRWLRSTSAGRNRAVELAHASGRSQVIAVCGRYNFDIVSISIRCFSVNRLPKYLLLTLLFGIGCLLISAQDAASTNDKPTSVSPSKSLLSLTADGVPACTEEFKLHSLPEGVYRVGGGVLPPAPIRTPQATFSDESRKYARSIMKTQHIKRFEAKSLVGLTVDTNGVPQNICVLNELGHGFDRRAINSVAEYRFKPATIEGKPVPVRLAVEVNFALW